MASDFPTLELPKPSIDAAADVSLQLLNATHPERRLLAAAALLTGALSLLAVLILLTAMPKMRPAPGLGAVTPVAPPVPTPPRQAPTEPRQPSVPALSAANQEIERLSAGTALAAASVPPRRGRGHRKASKNEPTGIEIWPASPSSASVPLKASKSEASPAGVDEAKPESDLKRPSFD